MRLNQRHYSSIATAFIAGTLLAGCAGTPPLPNVSLIYIEPATFCNRRVTVYSDYVHMAPDTETVVGGSVCDAAAGDQPADGMGDAPVIWEGNPAADRWLPPKSSTDQPHAVRFSLIFHKGMASIPKSELRVGGSLEAMLSVVKSNTIRKIVIRGFSVKGERIALAKRRGQELRSLLEANGVAAQIVHVATPGTGKAAVDLTIMINLEK